LRERQLDAVLLLTNSLRTAYWVWRAGVGRRVGYARYGRGPLLTDRCHPPRNGWRLAPISAVDYYLALGPFLGLSAESRQVELATTAAEEQAATLVWRHEGWADGQRVVVLNTGGAYGSAKQWPAAYFAELARRLADELGRTVLVNCGPAERETAEAIARDARHPRVVSLARETLSLGLTKAVIRRAELLISTDSGPRHIGAAFGIPTISIFGPTDPRWSQNYHARAIDLQRHVPCGPCGARTCPLGHHRCMRDLTVEHVFRAAAWSLAQSQQPQAA
jgi:heptosyltransferase-2